MARKISREKLEAHRKYDYSALVTTFVNMEEKKPLLSMPRLFMGNRPRILHATETNLANA